jgi:hypothetical protein
MADFNQVVSASPIIKLGNQTITYSTTEPTSPANGDLWYEPGSRYAAPWEWEESSGLWLGQPQDLLMDFLGGVTTSTRLTYPTEFYSSKYGTAPTSKILFLNVYVRAGTLAHTSTNYYTFSVEYLLGTGAFATAYTASTNTGTNPSALGSSGYRRVNETMSVYLPGNAWTIGLLITKIGSGSQQLSPVSAKLTVRYPRP